MEPIEPQSDVARRAELRRKKLLERSADRMSKILGVGQLEMQSVDDDGSATTSPITSEIRSSDLTPQSVPHDSPEQASGPHHLHKSSATPERASELQHLLEGFSGIAGSNTTMKGDTESNNQTFPRKVTLISTPTDFRQPRNESGGFVQNMLDLQQQRNSMTMATLAISIISAMGSFFDVNCVIPLITCLTFKYFLSKTNSTVIANRTFAASALAVDAINVIVTFLFVYVLVQAIWVG